MASRVRLASTFVEDVEAQLRWMEGRFADEQIDALQAGVQEAAALLGQFPSAGAIDPWSSPTTLRKLILRRVPFVIWYRLEEGRRGEVWLLRLFHVRQDRAHPRPRARTGRKRTRR